jgi:hypothetical protein
MKIALAQVMDDIRARLTKTDEDGSRAGVEHGADDGRKRVSEREQH